MQAATTTALQTAANNTETATQVFWHSVDVAFRKPGP